MIVDDEGNPVDDWHQRIATQVLGDWHQRIATQVLGDWHQRIAEDVLGDSYKRITQQVMGNWHERLMESMTGPVAERLSASIFTPELRASIEALRSRHIPPNWPREIDLDRVTTVIQDDGLPLVWVPPAGIVTEVLAAPDRSARVEVLLAHADDLIHDCRRVLVDVHAERINRQLPLAPRALDSFLAGHHEAALALAVVVIDAVIASWLPGKYEAVAKRAHFDPGEVPFNMLRLKAAVAPLRNFKQRYFDVEGDPPDALNRQVTVHYADASHFTKGNALVACLLMTSVLRALEEFEELVQR